MTVNRHEAMSTHESGGWSADPEHVEDRDNTTVSSAVLARVSAHLLARAHRHLNAPATRLYTMSGAEWSPCIAELRRCGLPHHRVKRLPR